MARIRSCRAFLPFLFHDVVDATRYESLYLKATGLLPKMQGSATTSLGGDFDAGDYSRRHGDTFIFFINNAICRTCLGCSGCTPLQRRMRTMLYLALLLSFRC